MKSDTTAKNLSRAATSPWSFVFRDSHHKGTLFTFVSDRWCVVDLENDVLRGFFARIAAVAIEGEADPDAGLNQCQLGCDLDTRTGKWVVDADDLPDLRKTYGQGLTVLWVQ